MKFRLAILDLLQAYMQAEMTKIMGAFLEPFFGNSPKE
jgi:hypothetical protein